MNSVETTVYITTYNYGKYIKESIESVLRQTYRNWELLIINDGSEDNTKDILKEYEGHPKIIVIHQENKGLTVSNNIALRRASGKFIMRLDADDCLEENALLVMSNILNQQVDVGLVYPDYYLIAESGELLGIERRKKVPEEVQLLDLPAHGACTLIRKRCLEELGGYNEKIRCQDGYDLWIRFIERFQVRNINLPLFYYRQHDGSLTSDVSSLLQARQTIKRDYVERSSKSSPTILGIIPARGAGIPYESPLTQLAGKSLIEFTIEHAITANALNHIVVVSEDENVLDYVQKYEAVKPIKRPKELGRLNYPIEGTLLHVLSILEKEHCFVPDLVMVLYIDCPLRRPEHIIKAVDTLMVYETDSVVSVCENLTQKFKHGINGLEPLIKDNRLRLERNAIYEGNGAVILTRRECITPERTLGKRVGHITMMREESVRLHSEFDLNIVEMLLQKSHK